MSVHVCESGHVCVYEWEGVDQVIVLCACVCVLASFPGAR